MFKNDGPLGWFSKLQDRTILSTCEAEICAISATSKKVVKVLLNWVLLFWILTNLLSSTMTMMPAFGGPTT